MAKCNLTISAIKTDSHQIETPAKALELLSSGVRLHNMPLVKQCIEYLDHQLDKTNLLLIYSSLSKCNTYGAPNEFEPSAPPIIENELQPDIGWAQELIDNLLHNCLLEIDKNADYILKQKEILQLSYFDILAITERDSLEISDETIVYGTIYRWAITECHKRLLTVNELNIRTVLRQLRYTPRYGLMTKSKFMSKIVDGIKGPTRSGVLEEKEWRLIKFYIEEKSKNRPIKDLPHKSFSPRMGVIEKPKILSSRSSSSFSTNTSTPRKTSSCNKTACEKCLINFLSCWTAVFD